MKSNFAKKFLVAIESRARLVAWDDVSGAREKLGVQNRPARRSANKVVRKKYKANIEHRAAADAPHNHGHSVSGIAIEARLRAVRLLPHLDWLSGRRRQPEPLRLTPKLFERGGNTFR